MGITETQSKVLAELVKDLGDCRPPPPPATIYICKARERVAISHTPKSYQWRHLNEEEEAKPDEHEEELEKIEGVYLSGEQASRHKFSVARGHAAVVEVWRTEDGVSRYCGLTIYCLTSDMVEWTIATADMRNMNIMTCQPPVWVDRKDDKDGPAS